METIQLENIAVIGGEVALAWAGGSESFISLEALRKNCPCAACQGEPDVTGKVLLPKVTYNAKSFELLRHERMGGYALQFFWADGHSTGIYSFPLLQALGQLS